MTKYCYHCGGELAQGAPPMIFPTDTKRANPRPGEPCKCDEVSPEYDKFRRSSYPNWEQVLKKEGEA